MPRVRAFRRRGKGEKKKERVATQKETKQVWKQLADLVKRQNGIAVAAKSLVRDLIGAQLFQSSDVISAEEKEKVAYFKIQIE